MAKKTMRICLTAAVLAVLVLAACSVPLHLPSPGGEEIRIWYGARGYEKMYVIEPETEGYDRVCGVLDQLSYHLSPRAGIRLTAGREPESFAGYAILIYRSDRGYYVYPFVSESGFLDMTNRHYAIGRFGSREAARWLADLELALADMEPETTEQI